MTRRRERLSARNGPRRSISSAGTATDHATYNQMPGMTSRMKPTITSTHNQKLKEGITFLI